MWGAGHLAWGYIIGKATSRALHVQTKASLLLLAALLPDLDEALPIAHRGPTHSLLLVIVAFTVAFILWGPKVTPYFAALAQHSLIDTLSSIGVQLLWPLTTTNYKLTLIPISGQVDLALEWTGFLLSLTLMLKTGDFRELLKPDTANLLAVMPLVALAPATFLAWNRPPELRIPTASFLAILSLPVLANIQALLRPEPKTAEQ